jgi:hypothetical protein
MFRIGNRLCSSLVCFRFLLLRVLIICKPFVLRIRSVLFKLVDSERETYWRVTEVGVLAELRVAIDVLLLKENHCLAEQRLLDLLLKCASGCVYDINAERYVN